ncbi:copper(I)-binding protein [Sphingomonas sp. BE123]|uniref:copper chaperone PCu(A)C n=1 Tax=unclassified Sphingomonas TaxID=196159 RepID=UPI00286208BA|nr:copper chaperone PCu(A)C [Sphingomonas sp. BE123]MDR6853650.1 copper(I)-binding protein [Sphingomonas sp. BE123]
MRSLVVAIAAAATLAGCEQAQLGVEDAWVRLPAVSSRPGAAYFTVKGGNEATTLLGVSSPAAVRTELHEMKHEGGMMTMAPIKDVAIPAGSTVKFEPGGKHIMLYDLSPELRAGGKVPLRLAFANGKTIEVEAELRAPGQEK